MTPHHILPRRTMNNNNVPAKTPRHDVGYAEGGVEAEGRVKGLEEDRLGGGVTWLRLSVRGGRMRR